MLPALLSVILLIGTPAQDSVMVNEDRLRNLERQVHTLRGEVKEFEAAKGYFDSIISGERTFWATLTGIIVTLIVAVGGVGSYLGIRRELRKVKSKFNSNVEKNLKKINRNEKEVVNLKREVSRIDDEIVRAYSYISDIEGEYLNALNQKIISIDRNSDGEIRNRDSFLIGEEVERAKDIAKRAIENNKFIYKDYYKKWEGVLLKLMRKLEGDTKEKVEKLYEEIKEIPTVERSDN